MTDASTPTIAIVCKSKSVSLRKSLIVDNFHLFSDHLDLLTSGQYVVQSDVSTDVFDIFIQRIQGETITLTKTNCASLVMLSDELGFVGLKSCTHLRY
jgi:hypothetical protein